MKKRKEINLLLILKISIILLLFEVKNINSQTFTCFFENVIGQGKCPADNTSLVLFGSRAVASGFWSDSPTINTTREIFYLKDNLNSTFMPGLHERIVSCLAVDSGLPPPSGYVVGDQSYCINYCYKPTSNFFPCTGNSEFCSTVLSNTNGTIGCAVNYACMCTITNSTIFNTIFDSFGNSLSNGQVYFLNKYYQRDNSNYLSCKNIKVIVSTSGLISFKFVNITRSICNVFKDQLFNLTLESDYNFRIPDFNMIKASNLTIDCICPDGSNKYLNVFLPSNNNICGDYPFFLLWLVEIYWLLSRV